MQQMREARLLKVDHDTKKLVWKQIEQEELQKLADEERLYAQLDELVVTSVAQSSANIYYQSDLSLITALQIALIHSDINSMIPMLTRSSTG